MKRRRLLAGGIVLALLAAAAHAAAVDKQPATVPPAAESKDAPTKREPKTQPSDAVKEARGVFRLKEAKWRLELTGGGGLPSGSERSNRGGDALFSAGLDYEIPIMGHGALGLRLLPAFVYAQHHGETVWGGGAGIAPRLYWVKDEQRGLFIEGEVVALGHANRFRTDSSNVDFISGGGIGYQCKAKWHTILKFEHISNAGLGKHNAGVNTLALGVGYSF